MSTLLACAADLEGADAAPAQQIDARHAGDARVGRLERGRRLDRRRRGAAAAGRAARGRRWRRRALDAGGAAQDARQRGEDRDTASTKRRVASGGRHAREARGARRRQRHGRRLAGFRGAGTVPRPALRFSRSERSNCRDAGMRLPRCAAPSMICAGLDEVVPCLQWQRFMIRDSVRATMLTSAFVWMATAAAAVTGCSTTGEGTTPGDSVLVSGTDHVVWKSDGGGFGPASTGRRGLSRRGELRRQPESGDAGVEGLPGSAAPTTTIRRPTRCRRKLADAERRPSGRRRGPRSARSR